MVFLSVHDNMVSEITQGVQCHIFNTAYSFLSQTCGGLLFFEGKTYLEALNFKDGEKGSV